MCIGYESYEWLWEKNKHNIDTVWRFNQQYVGILHDRVRNPSINLLNEVIWFNKP